MQEIEKKLTRPAAASLFYTATAAVGKAVAILTLPFFTARLGASGYGEYALFLCYEGLLFSAASMGLGGAAIYRALSRYKGCEERLLGGALGLSLLASLPLFLGAVLFLRNKLSPLLILLLLLSVLSRVCFTLYSAKCRYAYRYKPLCLLNLCADVGAPLIAAFLLTFYGLGALSRILGAAILGGLLGGIALFSILQKKPRLFDKEILRYLLSLELPLLPHYLSVAFLAEGARITVERVLGSDALGAYAVAHSIGLALSLITVSLGGAFQPWVLRKAAAGEGERVAKTAERLLIFLCTLTLLPILSAPELFSFLAKGGGFSIGMNAVPALAFTVVLSFLATVPICAKLSKERFFSISLPSFCSAITLLLFCPFLSRRLGLFGAGLGVLLAYLFFFLFHSITLKKDQKCILNVKNCFLIIVLFAGVGLLSPILYTHIYLRILLFALYSLAAILQAFILRSSLLEPCKA